MDDFIPTRASQCKKNAEKALEITTFEARKKISNPAKKIVKKEKKPKDDSEDDFDNDDDSMEEDDAPPMDDRKKQELEMKRFRYEVIKLGISALDKKKARAAKVELAVSLGAKPPKNKRRNYKKILAEKKQQKMRKDNQNKFAASGFDPSKLLMNKPSKVKVKKKLIKKRAPVEDTKKNGKGGMKKGKGKGKGKKNSGGILGVYGRVTKAKERQNAGGKKQKRRN